MGCDTKKTESKPEPVEDYTSFADDFTFMSEYTDMIELTDPTGQGKIAVSAALQGRVMTSSAAGSEGRSYGWINRELFASRDTLEHINVFGGEERFWLGPEGGQYSIFFEKGTEFSLDNWYTPRLIDVEPFEIKKNTPNSVSFTKKAALTNYSDFSFELEIERKVEILSAHTISAELGVDIEMDIKSVAYRTTNTLSNIGDKDWQKETGLLSIWLLGMYNASSSTTIIIPFYPGSEEILGKPVTDDYFGKVPSERLIVKDSVLYFSGDATYRSKIGLSPSRAKDILGSYDSENSVLTIVKYNKPAGVSNYVNSLWELQEQPYKGDVVNSYNDGPPAPGEKQLGQFYELETSSPALALKVGEKSTHTQLTCHFEGDEKSLNKIAQQLLGVSIEEIVNIF
ncbi:lipoprotein [Flagellimonas eckloniae]|uniref:Lipoprotein n=1 Tax=Flagellimonas eckloniae TaxID=346185 RepID=A0A0Q1HEF5_9FLAO|nr:lipoprotein [Allomuricauda eckloniae]